jgi:hypothetical protein
MGVAIMNSPTQRSKAYAKDLGYEVAIVEKWNAWAKVRQDLFGFGDLLCMKRNEPLLLIQTTTTANMAARWHKIKSSPLSAHWLSTGNKLEIWGWSKRGPRGQRKCWMLTRKVCGA